METSARKATKNQGSLEDVAIQVNAALRAGISLAQVKRVLKSEGIQFAGNETSFTLNKIKDDYF
jgi:hypothetical protein